MAKNILFIFGTRPEAIKMAPLIKRFKASSGLFETKVCITGQHRTMLDQILSFFEIIPDYDLNLMTTDQTLASLTSAALSGLNDVIKEARPDLIFVQGDTTTAFVGALAGFYNKVKIAHIEAGLRSGDLLSPYPEEANRLLISKIADFHFAPTALSVLNLNTENITNNVFNVGNTGIDALFLCLRHISRTAGDTNSNFSFLDASKKTILVTCHRRESFGEPLEQICNAITKLARDFSELQIVYPVHLNPNVRNIVFKRLGNIPNVFLIDPLDYKDLVALMDISYLILTDSGGIQEEAPSLGKPVLVLREKTERTEGITAGTAKLIGTNENVIYETAKALIEDPKLYAEMANAVNPYGDGNSSNKVFELIEQHL